jgi:hypothetical protein
MVGEAYASLYEQGYDIRPTIAITKAHINMPELQDAVVKGRLSVDGQILKSSSSLVVTRWQLTRFGICRELPSD